MKQHVELLKELFKVSVSRTKQTSWTSGLLTWIWKVSLVLRKVSKKLSKELSMLTIDKRFTYSSSKSTNRTTNLNLLRISTKSCAKSIIPQSRSGQATSNFCLTWQSKKLNRNSLCLKWFSRGPSKLCLVPVTSTLFLNMEFSSSRTGDPNQEELCLKVSCQTIPREWTFGPSIWTWKSSMELDSTPATRAQMSLKLVTCLKDAWV